MSRWPYALMTVAALAGGVGVMEAAAAAHRIADPHLTTSANFLMLDATASIAITAFARNAPRGSTWFLTAASILLGGGILFCADISSRAFAAERLFPLAAPIGGTLMIIGWLLTAIAAAVCLIKSPKN